jgi:hypothetical protein
MMLHTRLSGLDSAVKFGVERKTSTSGDSVTVAAAPVSTLDN